MTESRNVVAAQLVVLINGRVVGEFTSFNYTSMTPGAELGGLDQLTPFEIAPGAIKIMGTLGMLRRQATGGLQGRGLAAPIAQIADQRYFSILVLDRKNQTTFFRADHCWVQQEQWEAAARGRVQGSFTFSGLMWSNEIDVVFP